MSEFTKGMSFIFQSVCPLSKVHLEPYKMRNLLAVKIYFYFVANWGRQRGLLSRAVSDDCLGYTLRKWKCVAYLCGEEGGGEYTRSNKLVLHNFKVVLLLNPWQIINSDSRYECTYMYVYRIIGGEFSPNNLKTFGSTLLARSNA